MSVPSGDLAHEINSGTTETCSAGKGREGEREGRGQRSVTRSISLPDLGNSEFFWLRLGLLFYVNGIIFLQ